MTIEEKIKSDIECFERVLNELQQNNADDKSIAIVKGMLEGAKIAGGIK